MHLLYSAPDIDLDEKHGGSSHVIGAVTSLTKMCDSITLISKKGKLKCKNVRTIEIGPLGNAFAYFILPFLTSLFSCAFKRLDIVYERARIFGGGAILAAKIFGKSAIYEMIEPYTEVPVYTGQIKENGVAKKLIDAWHNFIIRRSDIVTITHDSFLSKVQKSNALMVRTGVDLDAFNPAKKDYSLAKKYNLVQGKTLAYVGSFNKWHATENIIRSAAKLIRKDREVKLLMIGAGGKKESCEQLAVSLNVAQNILFTGQIQYALLPYYINAADICLALFDRNYSPFRKLGYFYSPIKINEYMACGKPIIASNIGTLKGSLSNDVNGFLVDETNIDEIASTLTRLVRNKELLKTIGKTNLKYARKNLSWDKINSGILLALKKNV